MPNLNKHHIAYNPEWTVEIGYQEHKVITNIQRSSKNKEELYARLINLQHAISHECNRVRMELDTGIDCRQFFRGKKALNLVKRRKRGGKNNRPKRKKG